MSTIPAADIAASLRAHGMPTAAQEFAAQADRTEKYRAALKAIAGLAETGLNRTGRARTKALEEIRDKARSVLA